MARTARRWTSHALTGVVIALVPTLRIVNEYGVFAVTCDALGSMKTQSCDRLPAAGAVTGRPAVSPSL